MSGEHEPGQKSPPSGQGASQERFLPEAETLLREIERSREVLADLDAASAACEARISSLRDDSRRMERNMAMLAERKNALMDAIGEVRRKARDAQSEAQASFVLKQAILSDLRDIQAERSRVVNKLESIKDGLRRIESAKSHIEPVGKKQSELLGKAHALIKEAHNRMELSIILNR